MTLPVIKFYNIKTLLSVLEDVTLFQCIPFLNLLPPGINVSLDIVYSDFGGGGMDTKIFCRHQTLNLRYILSIFI